MAGVRSPWRALKETHDLQRRAGGDLRHGLLHHDSDGAVESLSSSGIIDRCGQSQREFRGVGKNAESAERIVIVSADVGVSQGIAAYADQVRGFTEPCRDVGPRSAAFR